MYSEYFETGSKKGRGWRDHLQVHPAADLFPLLSETDPAALKELAEDIRQHGQREPASYIKDSNGNRLLLDGRNRLDALEMLGRKIDINDSRMFEQLSSSLDARVFIISKNIHRRHLTAEQKRDLIAGVIRSKPESSNRVIAKIVGADHKTVGTIKDKLVATGEVSPVEKTIGKDGKARKQPTRLKHANPDCPGCGGNGYFRGGDSGRCYCACGSPLQSKTSTSPDCSRSGVSQVSTAPEKLTSGLPTGPDFPKTPTEQATVVETQAQPNPIIAAWHASTLVQREEFIEDLGDFIADWHFSPSTPISIALSIRILQNLIHSLGERDQQPISSVSLSKQSTDAEEEETGNQTADDGLTIPNYLKRPAP